MTNDQIDTLLNKAFEAYHNNDFAFAEESARYVLSVSPNQGDALFLLALIAERAGALSNAIDLLYSACKMYPEMDRYALSLAFMLDKSGREDEALSLYQKYPDNADAVVQMGLIYLRKNQLLFAREAFEKAVSLNPGLGMAYLGLAHVAEKEGKNPMPFLKQAVRAERSADTLSALVRYYFNHKKYDKALAFSDELMLLSASSDDYILRGDILCALGQLNQAEQSYQQAITVDTYNARAYGALGRFYHQTKSFTKAEEYYKKALLYNPKLFEALVDLGILLNEQKRKSEALEQFHAAILLHPRDKTVLVHLAQLVAECGDFSEALGLYFNVLSLYGADRALSKQIAWCIKELSKIDQKQASNFLSGWQKNFPNDKTAQKISL